MKKITVCKNLASGTKGYIYLLVLFRKSQNIFPQVLDVELQKCYTYDTEYDKYNAFSKVIDGNSLTIYANIKGGLAPISVGCYEKGSIQQCNVEDERENLNRDRFKFILYLS